MSSPNYIQFLTNLQDFLNQVNGLRFGRNLRYVDMPWQLGLTEDEFEELSELCEGIDEETEVRYDGLTLHERA
jgi:hypothetical protein